MRLVRRVPLVLTISAAAGSEALLRLERAGWILAYAALLIQIPLDHSSYHMFHATAADAQVGRKKRHRNSLTGAEAASLPVAVAQEWATDRRAALRGPPTQPGAYTSLAGAAAPPARPTRLVRGAALLAIVGGDAVQRDAVISVLGLDRNAQNVQNEHECTFGPGFVICNSDKVVTGLNLAAGRVPATGTSLSPSVGDLTALQFLDVTANALETLPSALGRLEQLKILKAGNNSLTKLPPLFIPSPLRQLHIDHNRLTTLLNLAELVPAAQPPPHEYQFPKLSILNACCNLITSTAGLKDVGTLSTLDVHDNVIHGPVPAHWDRIHTLSLTGNCWSCPLPEWEWDDHEITQCGQCTRLPPATLTPPPKTDATTPTTLPDSPTASSSLTQSATLPLTPMVTPVATPLVTPRATPRATPLATPLVTPDVTLPPTLLPPTPTPMPRPVAPASPSAPAPSVMFRPQPVTPLPPILPVYVTVPSLTPDSKLPRPPQPPQPPVKQCECNDLPHLPNGKTSCTEWTAMDRRSSAVCGDLCFFECDAGWESSATYSAPARAKCMPDGVLQYYFLDETDSTDAASPSRPLPCSQRSGGQTSQGLSSSAVIVVVVLASLCALILILACLLIACRWCFQALYQSKDLFPNSHSRELVHTDQWRNNISHKELQQMRVSDPAQKGKVPGKKGKGVKRWQPHDEYQGLAMDPQSANRNSLLSDITAQSWPEPGMIGQEYVPLDEDGESELGEWPGKRVQFDKQKHVQKYVATGRRPSNHPSGYQHSSYVDVD
eukprot:gene12287-340_t